MLTNQAVDVSRDEARTPHPDRRIHTTHFDRASTSQETTRETTRGATQSAIQEAALRYIVVDHGPDASKPSFESAALAGGKPNLRFDTEVRRTVLNDLRALDSLDVDVHGFELLRAPTSVADLYNDDHIATRYEPELETLLRQTTGANEVVVFDYTRRSDSATGATNADGNRGPAARVHVDYTTQSGPIRARDALGAEHYEDILHRGGRVAQINVWRPITGPVRRSPLALADARTISPGDLIATDQVFPDRVGEIYHLAYNSQQRWYWAPEMEPDEVLLIKGWDSDGSNRAQFTPHSAVQLADHATQPVARESIEARAYLVFAP